MVNKILVNPETAITFGSNSDTVTFTPKAVATGAGRISAQHDRGSGAKAMRYRWEARSKVGSNATLGLTIQLFLVTAHSAAANVDDGLGQSDAALSVSTQLSNARYIGDLKVNGTAANVGPWYASGNITIFTRYVSVAWWNASGQTLTNVDADHQFVLIPMPDEIQ
jgi:hypothetical protein